MSYKVIYSDFDEDMDTSTVTISTDLGIFHGWADLNPEDREYQSNFTGCYIAELRAVKRYLKKLKAKINLELKTLQDLEKVFISLKDFSHKSKEYRTLRKQIHIKEKKILEINDKIAFIEKDIISYPQEKINAIENLKKKINK